MYTYVDLLMNKQFLHNFSVLLMKPSMMESHAKGKSGTQVRVTDLNKEFIHLQHIKVTRKIGRVHNVKFSNIYMYTCLYVLQSTNYTNERLTQTN